MAKGTLMEMETNGGNTQVLRREDRQEGRQEERQEGRQEEEHQEDLQEDHQADHREVGTYPLRTIHSKSGSCQQPPPQTHLLLPLPMHPLGLPGIGLLRGLMVHPEHFVLLRNNPL